MNVIAEPIRADLGAVPLYLTQIAVDYEQAVCLLRIRDTYDWHQHLWRAFPSRDGEARDFLVRIDRKEDAYRALLISRSEPCRPDWCPEANFQSKRIPDTFFEHQAFAFSLLANPTKKVRSNASGERTKNGRRVPLIQREELVAWLQRKAETGGFAIDPDSLRTLPRGREYFHKKGSTNGAHASVEFCGQLRVLDHARFRATVATGIGSAKAFGFGLLVLSPIT